jgi:pimeloyl-ACP methyl ester carboxylesterase
MTNQSGTAERRTYKIGRVVAGSLIAGLVLAIVFVGFVVAGAMENVISGAVLVAFGIGWGLLVLFSTRWTDQPQRWAALPAAVFIGVGMLMIVWPGSVKAALLEWLWPPVFLGLVVWMTTHARASLRSGSRRWLLYPVFAILACAAVGATYENVQEVRDRASYPAPGRLVDVGGRRLHLSCAGSGTPTVVLFPGAGDVSSVWGWIAPNVARTSRVCVWDRAGRAWSDDAPRPQDGDALTMDLHTLLERAQISGPLVVAGHSFGGLAALNYAARFPEQVAGMVLLDATSTEMFTRLRTYSTVYEAYRRVSAVFPSLARLGVGRLAYRSSFDSLPAQPQSEERAFWSTARLARSQRDEWAEAPTLMRQARALESFHDRPLIVLTAGRGAQAGWLPLQDAYAKLSSNSEHRILANTEHATMATSEGDARESSRAIVDVVMAVRTGRSLTGH